VAALLAVLLALAAPSLAAAAEVEAAQSARTALKKALSRAMGEAAPASGAYVVDAESGSALFGWRSGTARVLASNTKLYTMGAALAAHGPGATLETRVRGLGAVDPTGSWIGDLYLEGGGDPTFGAASYNRARYAGGASIEALASELRDLGIRRVQGAVVGDESRFDSLRGTAYSGFGGSGDIGGPLTALAFNHGRTAAGRFQTDPPLYAAARLADALRRVGVKVDDPARADETPAGALELAEVQSPPMSRLAQITGVRSENWFAEELVKGLPDGQGTTAAGVAEVREHVRSLGAKASLADGSGLSSANRASPRQVVRFLLGERERPEFQAFEAALPTAGVNGTLVDRMRSGAARGNCHAKTGTLRVVTTLSGYCETRSGRQIAFSILMNGANVSRGRRLQDRMVQAMAGYRG
jgi:D-alanyl-D-alanine carboxypeptidase/D-alanyl-D-alanine-endopeptidase (penicillin-binding protein 4)